MSNHSRRIELFNALEAAIAAGDVIWFREVFGIEYDNLIPTESENDTIKRLELERKIR